MIAIAGTLHVGGKGGGRVFHSSSGSDAACQLFGWCCLSVCPGALACTVCPSVILGHTHMHKTAAVAVVCTVCIPDTSCYHLCVCHLDLRALRHDCVRGVHVGLLVGPVKRPHLTSPQLICAAVSLTQWGVSGILCV